MLVKISICQHIVFYFVPYHSLLEVLLISIYFVPVFPLTASVLAVGIPLHVLSLLFFLLSFIWEMGSVFDKHAYPLLAVLIKIFYHHFYLQ